MSDSLSLVEIVGQHGELLPARTVLSLFAAQGGGDPVDLDLTSEPNPVVATIMKFPVKVGGL